MTDKTLSAFKCAVNTDATLSPALKNLILNLFSGEKPQRLKVSEVAELLNVTMEAVRQWNWDGTLAATVTAEGSFRYHSADVLALAIERGGAA